MRTGPEELTPVSEINVTPLVDVMLVLLAIFMVTAPLLEQGIEVNLPKAATGQRLGDSRTVITLNREHVLYFNGDPVTLKGLRQKMGGLRSGEPIWIRADRTAHVDELIGLWDLCRETGFSQVRVTTLPES